MPNHQQLYFPSFELSADLQHGSHPLTKLKREPIIPIGPSIAYVPLTKGQFALIDAVDVQRVGRVNWCAQWNSNTASYYAVKDLPGGAKLSMHRFLAGTRDGFVTDHVSGHTLDNRHANLREATKTENAINARLHATNTSGFRGVSRNKASGRWDARIRVNRRRVYLGAFPTPQEAHEAYCEAAAKLHGEFRRAA